MKYQFVEQVEAVLFGATKGAWLSQLDSNAGNVSEPYYAAALEYCGRTVAGTVEASDPSCLCAIVPEGTEYASALVVVSHARARDEVRMLDLYVQPDLNLADSGPNYAALAWIAATAIVGCLNLTYEKFPATQLKLHAAFPLNKEFLTAIATAVFASPGVAEHYDVSGQGNWLLVVKKGNSGCRLEIVN